MAIVASSCGVSVEDLLGASSLSRGVTSDDPLKMKILVRHGSEFLSSAAGTVERGWVGQLGVHRPSSLGASSWLVLSRDRRGWCCWGGVVEG